jgi:plasmid maintenance system antidote protein VapI
MQENNEENIKETDTTEIEDVMSEEDIRHDEVMAEMQLGFVPVASLNPGHIRTAGEQLQWLMTENQLSQNVLAKTILKTSQGNVSEIIKGIRNVSVKQAETLCIHFGGIPEDWRDLPEARKKQKKHKMKSGEATTTVSIGQASTTGEGSPEKPVVIKEVLPPKEFTHARNAEVSLSYGITKSLGNFEFIRVDVWVKDFCESERKQECWDKLETEALKRLEKVLTNIDKVKTLIPSSPNHNPEVGNMVEDSPLGMELIPAPIVEEKKAEGDASEEIRKCIHKEVLRLAKLSRIKYKMAVEKLRESKLDHDFATALLEQLANNDVSFFVGEEENGNTKSEASSVEDIEGQGTGSTS